MVIRSVPIMFIKNWSRHLQPSQFTVSLSLWSLIVCQWRHRTIVGPGKGLVNSKWKTLLTAHWQVKARQLLTHHSLASLVPLRASTRGRTDGTATHWTEVSSIQSARKIAQGQRKYTPSGQPLKYNKLFSASSVRSTMTIGVLQRMLNVDPVSLWPQAYAKYGSHQFVTPVLR